MAFFDRVWVSTATAGTGAVALGPAMPGHRTFAAAQVPDGAELSYTLIDATGAFEMGVGTYSAGAGTFARTTITESSAGGAAIALSGSATLLHAPLAQDLAKFIQGVLTALSAGAAHAGQVPALNAAGQLDPSLLTGSKGYSNLPQLVLSAGGYAPPADSGQSVSPTAPHQIVVCQDDATGGYSSQTTVFGNNRKPAYETYNKTRGATPFDFSVPCLSADGILVRFFQASSGAGGNQTAHVASDLVVVDGAPPAGNLGEYPGAYIFQTGTGLQSASSPGYFGVQLAMRVNSRQQVYVAGRTVAKQQIAGTNSVPGAGTDFGANLLIGPGGSEPNSCPMKIDFEHSSLLATPEAGAEEVDTTAARYTTRTDLIRRRYVTADPAAPTIAVGAAAGSGATASITWSPDGGGRITVTAGTGSDSTGGSAAATITLAHPYPAKLFPVISAANGRASGLAGGAYTADNGANASSFLLYLPGMSDGKTYVFNFSLTGV